MRKNIEKWNYYLSIINEKTNEFKESVILGHEIPNFIYYVYPTGKIVQRYLTEITYNHHLNGGKLYFLGKTPTIKDINDLKEYAMKDIPFSIDNLYYCYYEMFDANNEFKMSSAIKLTDVIAKNNLFYLLSDAENHASKLSDENRIKNEFMETHKKDRNYNYTINGYKFLGWQNGWTSEYYDEDNNLCSESGKPQKKFGYSKLKYPEYKNCIDSKHYLIEVSHNQRGSENTVSCPICMIFWKYDCSD